MRMIKDYVVQVRKRTEIFARSTWLIKTLAFDFHTLIEVDFYST